MAIKLKDALSLWKGMPKTTHTDAVSHALQTLPAKMPVVTDFASDLKALNEVKKKLDEELNKIAKEPKSPSQSKVQECLKQIVEAVKQQIELDTGLRQKVKGNLKEVFDAGYEFYMQPTPGHRQRIVNGVNQCIASTNLGSACYHVTPASSQVLQKLLTSADTILKAEEELAEAKQQPNGGVAAQKAEVQITGAKKDLVSALTLSSKVVAI
jgi:hypothetical protein